MPLQQSASAPKLPLPPNKWKAQQADSPVVDGRFGGRGGGEGDWDPGLERPTTFKKQQHVPRTPSASASNEIVWTLNAKAGGPGTGGLRPTVHIKLVATCRNIKYRDIPAAGTEDSLRETLGQKADLVRRWGRH